MANALGHVLNQCLYFSRVGEGFARPTGVEAELYRAHPDIENEDTAAVRVTTDVGATIGFYVTFCAPEQQTPWIELEAEKASVLWDLDRALEIRWADGCTERREYGPEARFQELKMFRNFFRAVRGEEGLLCPFAATRAFTAAALGAYAAGTPIRAIGPAHIERVPDGESVATVVRGVGEDLVRVARAGQLFTEAGVAWA